MRGSHDYFICSTQHVCAEQIPTQCWVTGSRNPEPWSKVRRPITTRCKAMHYNNLPAASVLTRWKSSFLNNTVSWLVKIPWIRFRIYFVVCCYLYYRRVGWSIYQVGSDMMGIFYYLTYLKLLSNVCLLMIVLKTVFKTWFLIMESIMKCPEPQGF